MSDSILNRTKKALGLQPDYTAFDDEIIMHINSVLGTLNQLGIGPEEGFEIEDAEPTWDAFLGGDKRLNPVKTYVYLRVRMIFDPPTVGYHSSSMQSQITELEARISILRESLVRSVLVPTNPLEDFDV